MAGAPMKRRGHDAVVKRLEDAMARGPWLMGENFSAVDLVVGGALNFARKAFPGSDAIDAFVARCKARPAAPQSPALMGADR